MVLDSGGGDRVGGDNSGGTDVLMIAAGQMWGVVFLMVNVVVVIVMIVTDKAV